MGLPARQRRVLEGIEDKLRASDPRLAAIFFIFGRLTRDEDMPRIEELRHRVAMLLLRTRFLLAAVGRRLSRVRLRRRRAAERVTAAAGGPGRGRSAGTRPARPRSRGAWRPMAVFFPIALVLMSASIFIAARFGGTPRCAAATAVATAKPHPRGKALAKGAKRCRISAVAPVIPIGR